MTALNITMLPNEVISPDRMRIDKWLWAARFYKTRAQAVQAIQAGHVRLNDSPIKPARELKTGDRLDLNNGNTRWTVIVVRLHDQRRPASEAQQLYFETPESRLLREKQREEQRLAPMPGSELRGRPTKKARRQIRGFNEQF